GEERLPIGELRTRDVDPVDVEDVEERVAQRALGLAREHGLEEREVVATASARDELSVEERRVEAERFERLAQLGQALGPVEVVARVEAGPSVREEREEPVSVPLDLVEPPRALGGLLERARELGREGRDLPSGRDGARELRRARAEPRPLAPLRPRRALHEVVGFDGGRVAIAILDEEPLGLLRLAMRAHEVPAPLELLAEELE